MLVPINDLMGTYALWIKQRQVSVGEFDLSPSRSTAKTEVRVEGYLVFLPESASGKSLPTSGNLTRPSKAPDAWGGSDATNSETRSAVRHLGNALAAFSSNSLETSTKVPEAMRIRVTWQLWRVQTCRELIRSTPVRQTLVYRR
jgi:hypothetical protein